MAGFFKIVRVLTWKNWLLMRRKPKPQLFIFMTPILLMWLLGYWIKPLVMKANKEHCARPLVWPKKLIMPPGFRFVHDANAMDSSACNGAGHFAHDDDCGVYFADDSAKTLHRVPRVDAGSPSPDPCAAASRVVQVGAGGGGVLPGTGTQACPGKPVNVTDLELESGYNISTAEFGYELIPPLLFWDSTIDTDGFDACSWPNFSPILDPPNVPVGLNGSVPSFAALGPFFNFAPPSTKGVPGPLTPSGFDASVGCPPGQSVKLFVLGANDNQSQVATAAAAYLTNRPGQANASAKHLATPVLPIFVATAAELDGNYTAMTFSNSTDSGCFMGLSFTSESSHAFTIRPPFVPGGRDPSANTPRTWFTEEQRPRENPITPTSPRDATTNAQNGPGLLGGAPGYATHGVLAVQHAMAVAIANHTLAGAPRTATLALLENLKLQRLPYPQWVSNYWPTVLASMAPWFILIPLMFGAANLGKDIVLEKEHKIKAAMMMMGVRLEHHWTAWFFRGFAGFGLSMLLVAGISSHYSLFSADFTVLAAFFLLSAAAVVCQTFLFSSMFQKGTNAAMACGFGIYVTFLPYQYGIAQDATTGATMPGDAAQYGTCSLPASCIGVGMYAMSTAEVRDVHITWSNIDDKPAPESIALGGVLLMLLVDCLWTLVLACYIEMIYPGEYGVPKHPLFPIHWLVRRFKSASSGYAEISAAADDLNHQAGAEHVQAPANPNAEYGLKTAGLCKVFPGRNSSDPPVVAVNNLSLGMQVGEITALLGENGAGKTTTMSMLAGLFAPTQGTMEVDGMDVMENQSHMHTVLGVCPQHDVLWDRLTVAEHLTLFGWLKGVEPKPLKAAVANMVRDLALTEKSKALSSTLSGGQKRRLSCGIALVGGSKVVILDEPTSGCDPKARRDIWDLLLRHKEGRTILLSTHFMDEADVLGDKIAIMSSGKLVAAGTSDFLKQAFGTGYTLTVTKQPQCRSDAVVDLTKRSVPSAKLKSDIGTELAITIPREASAVFPRMLRELDAAKTQLSVDTFGVTITTMEEVFLTASKLGVGVGSDIGPSPLVASRGSKALVNSAMSIYEDELPGNLQLDKKDDDIDNDDAPLLDWRDVRAIAPAKVARSPTFAMQLRALIWKRSKKIRSEKLTTSMQVVMPIIFLMIHLFISPTNYGPVTDSADSVLLSSPTNVVYNADELGLATGGEYVSRIPGSISTDDSVEEFVGNWTQGEHTFDAAVTAGLSVSADAMTAWFNGNYYHSVAEAHALAANYLIANATGIAQPAIVVTNLPMPESTVEKASASSVSSTGFIFALTTLFAVNVFGCVAVYVPIEENANNAKHMQLVSGVAASTYWFSQFIVDYALGLFLTGWVMMLSSVGDDKVWGEDGAGAAIVLLFLFFPAFMMQVYTISLGFTVPANGVRAVLFSNVFLAEIPLIACFVLRATDNIDIADGLVTGFAWLPIFSLTQGFVHIGDNYGNIQNALKLKALPAAYGGCTDVASCCAALEKQLVAYGQVEPGAVYCTPDYFSYDYPGIGSQVVSLVFQFVVYGALLVLIERKYAAWLYAKLTSKKDVSVESHDIDSDVLAERDRIQNGDVTRASTRANDLITVRRVKKFFGPKRAVDDVSVGIAPQQCFGLLGVNGAGKTTLFKMFTGDHQIGEGDIKIGGFDVATQLQDVQRSIGYVPQFDALLGYMTGRELLSFYGQLKGLPQDAIPQMVEHLIRKLYLQKHADKPCRTYSGGNKRKLSVATALVGSPEIVLLDEPTTGMDPGSRRFLWNVILGLAEDGCSIVLTTHSMEECEALCTRLTIMVQGKLKCLGSPQHLKDRFGSGYTARIVAGDPATGAAPLSEVLQRLAGQFPCLAVKDQHTTTATVSIEGAVVLADLFEALELLKQNCGIMDYSCSQTSLEQIFLQFAREDLDLGSGLQPTVKAPPASYPYPNTQQMHPTPK